MADIVLEGWLSVLAALQAGRRTVCEVLIQRDRQPKAWLAIRHHARARGVEPRLVSAEEIEGHAQGTSHGGVLALAGPRRFEPLAELAQQAAPPFVVLLDGVEDPYNLGQALRALRAAGADGVVLRQRAWGAAESIVVRASAGASEALPTAQVSSVEEAVEHFRARGLAIACTSGERRATSLYDADLAQPLFLIIGGERRGISRAILSDADLLLRIPYAGDFDPSLGATAATAVLAFEVARQRR